MPKLLLLVTKLFKSKTLITNYAALIASTLTLWTQSDLIAEYPEIAAAFVSVLAGVNLLLRLVTSTSLEDK